MENIVAEYNSIDAGQDHIEFEVSVHLTLEDFMKAIAKYSADDSTATSSSTQAEFTTTIDFITGTNPKKIRRLYFSSGVKTLDVYETKQRVFSAAETRPHNIKAKISVERPSAPFQIPRDALVRFKTRVSYPRGNFRVDFTLTRQEKFAECDLKTVRDKLFIRGMNMITPDIDLSMYNGHELEIEFIGDKLTEEHIVELRGIVNDIVSGRGGAALALAAAEIVDRNDRLEKFARGELSFKQLAPAVISITRQEYIGFYPPIGWFVTPKYDGTRAFLMNHGGKLYTIGSTTEVQDSPVPDFLLADCEIVNGRAYIFDVMVCGGNITAKSYEARIEYIPVVVQKLSAFGCQAKPIMALTDNYVDELKLIWAEVKVGGRKVSSTSSASTNYIPNNGAPAASSYTIPLDGIIFIRPGDNYVDTRSYKWKPLSHTSIDFYAVECPRTLIGIKPYIPREGKTLYLLFVGINRHMLASIGLNRMPQYKSIFANTDMNYFPIQFSPSVNPLGYLWWHDDKSLNRKVVELRMDIDSGEWIYMRTRDDRVGEINYWGNDFRVAELTYLNYIDVFEFKDLLAPGDDVYFSGRVDNAYKSANAYKRFVISQMIDKYATGKILDLMCGRGADIFRYQSAGVREVLAMDIDPAAIAEMLRRKLNPRKEFHPMKKFTGNGIARDDRPDRNDRFAHNNSHAYPLIIHAQVADMRLPPDQLVTLAEKFGYYPGLADFAICNFAIHYLCGDVKHIRGFLTFVARMLKPGGTFMFTTFDGTKIFDLLKNTEFGHVYQFMENDQAKYAIKKLYSSDKLAGNGQMISVKLPFAEKMVDEPLANIDTIITIGKKLGFSLEHRSGFDEWSQAFSKLPGNIVKNLTTIDQEYIALHSIVILKLTKRVAAATMTADKTTA